MPFEGHATRRINRERLAKQLLQWPLAFGNRLSEMQGFPIPTELLEAVRALANFSAHNVSGGAGIVLSILVGCFRVLGC